LPAARVKASVRGRTPALNQLVAALQRFGIGRLVAILGIGAGVAAALFAITMNLGQPKALLYSNLDLKEAGSITQALDQAGVKYEVKGDGSTILVPRDSVASTRLMLSGKGLPTAASVGYEIFDNANALGQTDFVQQLNRQRALEGELARTIRGLDGVTAARVHLVLPKRQLFEEESEQPSAAVNITSAAAADRRTGPRHPEPGGRRRPQPEVRPRHRRRPARQDPVRRRHRLGRGRRRPQVRGRAAHRQAGEGPGRGRRRRRQGPGQRHRRCGDEPGHPVQQETFDPDGQVVRSESTTAENAKQNEPEQQNGQVSITNNVPGANTGGSPTTPRPAAARNRPPTTRSPRPRGPRCRSRVR
jgi:flagellar M-ring protein FliF